jgi:hypothetical protein
MAETKKQIEQKKEEKLPLQILANADIQKGVYSNIALVHHNENEFILDFLFRVDADPQLVSRVILSPEHMEKLVGALNENLAKYREMKKKKK